MKFGLVNGETVLMYRKLVPTTGTSHKREIMLVLSIQQTERFSANEPGADFIKQFASLNIYAL